MQDTRNYLFGFHFRSTGEKRVGQLAFVLASACFTGSQSPYCRGPWTWPHPCTCSNLFISDLTLQGATMTCSKLVHIRPYCPGTPRTHSTYSSWTSLYWEFPPPPHTHSTLFTVRKVVGLHSTEMPSYFLTFISQFPNETSGRNRHWKCNIQWGNLWTTWYFGHISKLWVRSLILLGTGFSQIIFSLQYRASRLTIEWLTYRH